MANENSSVLKLVARLVMDYLDEQNLTDAYNTFCETSRHLSDQEYLAYSQGIKSFDTGIGLVTIVTEYFRIKDKLRDFIRSCPKTSVIIDLIDTTNLQSRLDLLLKVLKDNLLKFDQIQEDISRKRRKTENDLFEVSQTNTSTPETIQPSKRRKLSTTSRTLSNNNEKKVEEKEAVIGPKDIIYISSPETSNKEDDVTEDESTMKSTNSSTKIAPPPELLSETILKKPDFAENLAEIINKTLAEREEHEKSAEATSSQNILTKHDVQDILSKTENDFDDILKEVIDKYLTEGSESIKTTDSLTSSPVENGAEEVPLKQRLRPRTLKKIPSTERKKKKINIISNEVYTGPLPLCLQNPSTSSALIPSTINPITSSNLIPSIDPSQQSLILVPIMPTSTSTFIPLQSVGNIICDNSIPITTTTGTATATESNVQIILSENPSLPNVVTTSKEVIEKAHITPKTNIQASFLESKCKSTPRRKAQHVRILDFNQTPSGRLGAIKECKTPSNGIRMETPGSAPASIMASQKTKVDFEKNKIIPENGDKSIEIVDESSNSNSISNTPKVAKNRRRRKIEIDSKLDKTIDETSPKEKPMTREEWMKMREEQKNLSVDDRMRIIFQQQSEANKSNSKRRKTPKKKRKEVRPDGELKKSKTIITTNVKHGKAKLCAKFKVTSPRKSALLRKTPKKKKLSMGNSTTIIVNEDKEKIQEPPKIESPPNQQHCMPKLTPIDAINASTKKDEEMNDSNDLNRSDTVQEVANLLTHLPETILAKTNSGSNFEQAVQKSAVIDPAILMETPFKTDSISPLPNTPRFAVPLISAHQETPMAKEIVPVTSATSILKVCDILTPSFPITPGFKVTPAKSEPSPSGYSSRRTDYSSCSSYYKPDESEDINQNLESIIKQSRADRSSQSESDCGNLAIALEVEKKEKIRTGSTKKVECPGALERVLSFTEDTNAVMMPHYNMNEEGLLSESMITTCSDDSSSSFTCSTCSTDPSSDENTMEKLIKASNVDDRDSEWQCDEEIDIETNKSLVDEKTGEVRYPLRNWVTPKKIDVHEEVTKSIIEEVKITTIYTEPVKTIQEQKEEEMKQHKINMEEVRQRTINIIKQSTATTTAKKMPPKFKKANVKQFKLPAEQPRPVALTRRDQILQHTLTERPKSTPLKLIPTTSSSRRKCLTPRKTIIMDELPKSDPAIRKVPKKRQSSDKGAKTAIKSPVKPEKISVENINDNAVMMHDEHPSLNISSSFQETSEDEEENTVVDKTARKVNEEGSNTFQRTLIAQGFEKAEAKDLQKKFVDKIEEEQLKQSAKESPKSNLVVSKSQEIPKSQSEACSSQKALKVPSETVTSLKVTKLHSESSAPKAQGSNDDSTTQKVSKAPNQESQKAQKVQSKILTTHKAENEVPSAKKASKVQNQHPVKEKAVVGASSSEKISKVQVAASSSEKVQIATSAAEKALKVQSPPSTVGKARIATEKAQKVQIATSSTEKALIVPSATEKDSKLQIIPSAAEKAPKIQSSAVEKASKAQFSAVEKAPKAQITISSSEKTPKLPPSPLSVESSVERLFAEENVQKVQSALFPVEKAKIEDAPPKEILKAQPKNDEKLQDDVKPDNLVNKPELNLSSLDSESEEDEETEEDDLDFAMADIIEKNVFAYEEPVGLAAKKDLPKVGKLCAPSKLQIDGRTVKIDFSGAMDLFTLEPNKNPSKKEDVKPSEPKILTKGISIDKILTMIHGNH